MALILWSIFPIAFAYMEITYFVNLLDSIILMLFMDQNTEARM